MKKIPTTSVLGIDFACLDFAETLRLLEREITARKNLSTSRAETNFWGKTEKITHKTAFFVTTPNPEICLYARHDENFRKLLNTTDLRTPDGTGILWASTYLAKPKRTKLGNKISKWTTLLWGFLYPPSLRKIIPARVTGSDLTLALASLAEKKGWRIFLLGASAGVAEKAGQALQKKFPKLKIAGTYAGSPRETEEKHIRTKIIHAQTDILLVAYGAPAQELWLAKNLRFLAGVKCAIGVGGTLDFLAGNKSRAPKFLRQIGLEWLWRLCIEPSRYQRIKRAVVDFPRVIEEEKNKIK